ncbi:MULTISPECIES: DUF4307 domain-containing protein [Streptomyces]|uniref:Putative membrane protein n=1 Tax=Streptomyces scabiei (strain 87.22) TaxID=680198 RepID=C9ZGT3_STRSW|nr:MULTISPECIES: DUF4307 domain-containing protein [Streptomyces]MBP5861558.1 DUF4307 domain-containing protein [Streptomyces sp. LBUM 1484]MBP5869516.1 DUF4307 domain-containing protein [Streptomyces sp. LBUM 1485]MBP5907935.1 DUF4307 domain-containing protein [Streptomyces sp. LBUM 1478]MBP5929101.1 DUF4307 domain-containing protein [Streptomyces sp. LBUM 1479]KFG09952.1 membrane protein [Streptomyces scabiei]
MTTASTRLPEGRYGRSADGRADRRLKVIGGFLGAALLVLIGWFAYHYVAGNRISVEIYTFDTSARAVKVHLRGDKDAGVDGYCTVRSQTEDGTEVGRADFRFGADVTEIDRTVTLKTTSRGTTAELLGCHAG